MATHFLLLQPWQVDVFPHGVKSSATPTSLSVAAVSRRKELCTGLGCVDIKWSEMLDLSEPAFTQRSRASQRSVWVCWTHVLGIGYPPQSTARVNGTALLLVCLSDAVGKKNKNPPLNMPTWPRANNRCFHMLHPQTNGRVEDRLGSLRKCLYFVQSGSLLQFMAPLIERGSWSWYDVQLRVPLPPPPTSRPTRWAKCNRLP